MDLASSLISRIARGFFVFCSKVVEVEALVAAQVLHEGRHVEGIQQI